MTGVVQGSSVCGLVILHCKCGGEKTETQAADQCRQGECSDGFQVGTLRHVKYPWFVGKVDEESFKGVGDGTAASGRSLDFRLLNFR